MSMVQSLPAGLSERRTKARIPLKVPIALTSGGTAFAAMSYDLSGAGLFLATRRKLAVGADVELELELEGEVVTAKGRVLWSRSGADEQPPGIGIAFTQLDEDARGAIEELCDVRQPMVFDDSVLDDGS
jgi:uncharacterized protein (TIGR02266 family)